MPIIGNAEAIAHWETLPQTFIDSFGDEGDLAHQYLLNPTLFALLGDVQGKTILDAGCGQGYLARLLSKRGAKVTGLEPATPLIEYAIKREEVEQSGVRYIQADLSAFTDTVQLFDIIIANMVLMDIPDDEAALDACFAHLRPGGQFICSLIHPCFEESDSVYQDQGYIAVHEYFREDAIPQRWGYRFHRPLSHYFTALIRRGGVIRSVVEPQLDVAQAQGALAENRNLYVPAFIVIQAVKS
ncbi:MAG: class I SAM-dependent methyltransferase [Herpetosiphonaceae bacterium]|nr:class I SAM-dependent methyltransferase [Herpetosiphonaceae bacterium]